MSDKNYLSIDFSIYEHGAVLRTDACHETYVIAFLPEGAMIGVKEARELEYAFDTRNNVGALCAIESKKVLDDLQEEDN